MFFQRQEFNLFILSLKLLRREWRAGEWQVLFLAIIFSVGSLSTVGLFADRVRQALQQQAQNLIGADLRITSTRPLPTDYRNEAKKYHLRAVMSLTFPSMVLFKGESLLSEIQTAEPGYPLRGKLIIDSVSSQLSSTTDGEIAEKNAVQSPIPLRGTIWVDERFQRRFNLQLGDRVNIGRQQFRITARIVKDIDQSIGFASFLPRVLMNAEDIVTTGLMQEGSRMTYRLMYAGDPGEVKLFRDALNARLSGNEKLEDVRDARPEIRTALDRAESFLGLAALTSAILAAVTMALAAQRFVFRHLDFCAVMRCLGAQQNQIVRLFTYQFLLLGMVAVVVGCILGYMTQAGLVWTIEDMRTAKLPEPSVRPALKASLSGLSLLLGLTVVPILQLRNVSPLRVFRRESITVTFRNFWVYGLVTLILAGLFLWQAGTVKLGLVILSVFLLALLGFAVAAGLMLLGMTQCSRFFTTHWRYTLVKLVRHIRINILQIVAISLGGMALLFITVIRGNLLQSWQNNLPIDTPNRFIVNVQSDQQQPLLDTFYKNGIANPKLFPMVRGRLVAINHQSISADRYPDQRARALIEREFNLSWAAEMPNWNTLVAGQWWTSAERGQLSIEEGIAKTLNIRLGDILTYDVAGSQFTARVSNLRKVEWDSMKVNFFVITTPELLQNFPVSYLTSIYLPPDKRLFGDLLSREFTNLLIIDTGEIIDRVKRIIGQISQTISVIFIFTLLSGVAVLYATLLVTKDERIQEVMVLRTFGASGAYIRKLYLSEFFIIGALSGLLSALGAIILGWLVANQVLGISYEINLVMCPLSVISGSGLVMLGGWLVTGRFIDSQPLQLLHE